MKAYLNAKLILFSKILKKKTKIISDKNILPFKILKNISKKRGLKIIDINSEFSKIKSQLPTFPDFKKKNLSMAILVAKICGIKEESLPKGLSLALGTNYLTPLELAAAYSIFPNGGRRVEPYFIQKIIEVNKILKIAKSRLI